MERNRAYLLSANQILQSYHGEEPFASFLKKYFAANTKFGSKDRKEVRNLCYCFFRLGKAVMNVSLEEKMLIALFLCSNQSKEILQTLKPEWNQHVKLHLSEKLLIINPPTGRAGYSLLIQHVFPWNDELSTGIDHQNFCKSFFIQPDLFLRLRPGKEKIVKQKLHHAGIQFEIISDSCLALLNSSKIDEIIELDKEAVIQDYNSQEVGNFFPVTPGQSEIVWDCCAGSGGKSIMACDLNPAIELTASDMRESILFNLKKRFEKAGIKKYKSSIADLTSPFPGSNFQVIICDVPCTGSGTWSRTPEQLYFFDENKITSYASLQKKIISNVVPHLQPGGSFVYITCSVFRKENEEAVDYIKNNFKLDLLKMEVLNGYDKKADSMFVAVLQKQL